MKDIKKFSINRKTWLRYRKDLDKMYYPFLLNRHGMQCCLGQVARQCGITDDYLMNIGPPSEAICDDGYDNQFFFMFMTKDEAGDLENNDNIFAVNCMKINDDRDTDDAEKERRLIEEFGSRGYELSFYF